MLKLDRFRRDAGTTLQPGEWMRIPMPAPRLYGLSLSRINSQDDIAVDWSAGAADRVLTATFRGLALLVNGRGI